MGKSFYRVAFRMGVLCIALANPLIANAQLEEVVVTATKRSLNLQDVPMSISAVDGKTLEEFSISNFYDMNIPGVHIAQGGMNDNAFIRGIGQSSGNFGFENSAPFYVDGIYNGRARGTRLAWLDADRIEVIKGPVPTYLGKNASAGGIAIVSRRPGDEVEGFIDLYNEFEHEELAITGAVSIPVSDTFRLRIAGKYRDMNEGWMINTYSGKGEPQQEDMLYRLSMEWDITDRLQFWAKIEGVDAEWFGVNTQQTDCSNPRLIDSRYEDCRFDNKRATFFDPANHPTGLWSRNVPRGLTNINDFEYDGYAFSLTYNGDSFQVTSLTGLYEYENTFLRDPSHSTFDRGMANFEEEFEQFSQELRIQSTGDDRLEWMAGVYYDENDNINATNNSLPAAMGMIVIRDNDEDGDSWAVFGEVGFNVSEQVKITAGGRYTEYTKKNLHEQEVRAPLVAGQPYTDVPILGMASFTINNKQSDSKFQPSIQVEFRPNENTMYFASYREGFKAGGIDHQPGNSNPDTQLLEPEQVEAFEVGARWELMDGALRINATAFHADYSDYQVSIFDAPENRFITRNAAEAQTQGLELDTQWAASSNLTLSAYVSFLNAEFADYKGAQCYLNPRQTAAEGCVQLLDASGNPTGTTGQDMSGQPLQFAPDFSGTLTADYSQPINDMLELFGTFTMFFTEDYTLSTNRDPDLVQSGYETIDLRLGVGNIDNKWQVAFVGKNLTDEKILEWKGDTPLGGSASHFALLKRTRQYSVQAVYRF